MVDPDLQLRRGPTFKSLTINVEFCKDNSGTSKKMRYFRKNKVGAGVPQAPPLDLPLGLLLSSSCSSVIPFYAILYEIT